MPDSPFIKDMPAAQALAAWHAAREAAGCPERLPAATVPVAKAAGLVPLVGSLACDGGLLVLCVPWSWYMGAWAAVFGAFVGLSIRLVRERRRFEAQQSRAG